MAAVVGHDADQVSGRRAAQAVRIGDGRRGFAGTGRRGERAGEEGEKGRSVHGGLQRADAPLRVATPKLPEG
jgi:hypothetical protein